ncbi:hypothetical protein Tco_0896167 [Tanacetum coccineum]
MAKSIHEEESFNLLEIGEDIFSYDSPLCLEFEKYNHMYDTNGSNEDTFICDDNMQEPITGRKGKTMMAEPGTESMEWMSTVSSSNGTVIVIMKGETLRVKIGHTNDDKSVKYDVLNDWVLDSFELESYSSGINDDPYSRDLHEYVSEFENEIT